jgi:hypothetical protein
VGRWGWLINTHSHRQRIVCLTSAFLANAADKHALASMRIRLLH